MDAGSFHFTMSLPGDVRLIAAVRDVTVHAAGYAGLSGADAQALAAHVVAAAEAAIAATHVQDAPIEFVFDRDGATLRVTITCEVEETERPPVFPPSDAITVEWSRAGTRQTCRIVQPVA